MTGFEVVSPFKPSGDQPAAIASLATGIERGEIFQTLRGITGSGKTATIAWTIEATQRPTLVIEPNKSLAAQLSSELRELFPNNRVEFFVSYYDYYQPEAYLPTSDTFIEKDSSINEEIDRLRLSTTSALLTRRDVIVVASVSCIYGLGSPQEYRQRIVEIKVGSEYNQRDLLKSFVELQYSRNDVNLIRGTFRVRGDTIEIHPSYEEQALRIEFYGDLVERIVPFDAMTGNSGKEVTEVTVFASTHYVAGEETIRRATQSIEGELRERLAYFNREGKLLEAQRLSVRTEHDLEMLSEVGVCSGIENYSRHFDGRQPGEPPYTLLDFFPDDFLVVIDESHVAVPQLRGQHAGDRSRKDVLVEHGFRLPSAIDNRPLRFEEFWDRVGQCVFVSATPGEFELEASSQVVDQVIRPTGLLDPEVVIQPTLGQIDDLKSRIDSAVSGGGRVLVTTLTKKMAEDLTDYLVESGLKVQYLHSDIDTIARIQVLRDLRVGTIDVIVGINLLREGLDLPEVSLVAILDADKEGFLRSASSLIQTMGRAARNVDGLVVLYADTVTRSMHEAISITQKRRQMQIKYNLEHGIDPKTIRKAVTDILGRLGANSENSDKRSDSLGHKSRSRRSSGVYKTTRVSQSEAKTFTDQVDDLGVTRDLLEPALDLADLISRLELEMKAAAQELRFEEAALLRDELVSLRSQIYGVQD